MSWFCGDPRTYSYAAITQGIQTVSSNSIVPRPNRAQYSRFLSFYWGERQGSAFRTLVPRTGSAKSGRSHEMVTWMEGSSLILLYRSPVLDYLVRWILYVLGNEANKAANRLISEKSLVFRHNLHEDHLCNSLYYMPTVNIRGKNS